MKDAERHLKRCERLLRGALIATPEVIAVNSLLSGDSVEMGDLEVSRVSAMPDVASALDSLDRASELLAKRSLELTVVKMAPSAKTGYKTLEIMANAGSISPGADKALKEAIKMVEEEEKESKKKTESAKTGGWGKGSKEQLISFCGCSRVGFVWLLCTAEW